MPKTWFVLLLIIGFPHNCIDICLVELEFILTILVLPLLLPRREAGLCRRVLCAVALRLWTVFFLLFFVYVLFAETRDFLERLMATVRLPCLYVRRRFPNIFLATCFVAVFLFCFNVLSQFQVKPCSLGISPQSSIENSTHVNLISLA